MPHASADNAQSPGDGGAMAVSGGTPGQCGSGLGSGGGASQRHRTLRNRRK